MPLTLPIKIAIIAALEREVRPLLKDRGWQLSPSLRAGHRCYESERAIVVCAGIGGEAARRACEQLLQVTRPAMLISAGLAGAMVPSWKVGELMVPETIISSGCGAPVEVRLRAQVPALAPRGALFSGPGIAGVEGKRLLAEQYRAELIDMESASVAAAANAHEIPFAAIKAVSDEYDFPVPDMEAFVDGEGRFHSGRFVLHAACRPQLWPVISRLASNTRRASDSLCQALRELIADFRRVDASDLVFINGGGTENTAS